MKYLKTFERFEESNLGEEIAQDLLPRFQKMREEGQTVTVADFDRYMEERGADAELSDSVLHYLVNIGFDFDIEGEDEDYEDVEFELRRESLSYSGGDVTKMPVKIW